MLMSEMFSMNAKSPAVSAATAMLFLSGELPSTAVDHSRCAWSLPSSIHNLAGAWVLLSLLECCRFAAL